MELRMERESCVLALRPRPGWRRKHPRRCRPSGAPGRTRTSTGVSPPDFESGASTNSATGAWGGDNTGRVDWVNAEMRRSGGRQRGAEWLCGRWVALWTVDHREPPALKSMAPGLGLDRAIGRTVEDGSQRAVSKGAKTMHGVQTLTRSRPAVASAILVTAVGVATILGAYYFQYVIGLRPCPLCLEQRVAYYVSIPLAIVVALAASRDAPRPLVTAGLG